MLIIAGGAPLALSRFSSASSPPKVVRVSAHEASSIVALGAAAEAYSASRVASASLPGTTPGLAQPEPGCTCIKLPAVKAESPKVLRKAVQSAVEKTLV